MSLSAVGPAPAEAAALARAIEPLAIAAWPAREAESHDGWLWRFTDGFSRRANSVATLAFAPGDLPARLAAVEHAYAARRLPPTFQLTPITQPDGLAEALLARGYRAASLGHVCVAQTGACGALLAAADRAGVCDKTDPRFRDLVTGGSRSPADGRERLAILDRLELPHVCVLAEDAGAAVACGVGVRTGDWVSFHVMRTHPAHRRRGHARRALAGLARWAEAQGASRLFLQVEDGNAAAEALYAGVGFVPAYSYRFFVHD